MGDVFMKRSMSFSGVVILFTVVLAAPTSAQSAEERGRTLMEEADRRISGYGDYTATLGMTLRTPDGSERVREMRVLGLEASDGGDRTLVVFERPGDLRGTTILTATHSDGSSDQWLYLPALRRSRRIASSDQSDAFTGSQFTYEDLGSQDAARFRHRYVREEPLGGVDAHVVERVPVDPSSGYTRQVLWLDTEELRVLRIDYYDDEGGQSAPAKGLTLEEYRRHGEGQWRAARMVMTHHRTGASTELRWSDYAFGTGLTEADFDPRRLGRSR